MSDFRRNLIVGGVSLALLSGREIRILVSACILYGALSLAAWFFYDRGPYYLCSAAMLFGSPVQAQVPDKSAIYCLGEWHTAEEVSAINALAKMLYGEARGVKSTTEKAACVWVVLNRVDDPRWSDDIIEVLSQPYQFGGYRESFPVEDWARTLAADVYDRWQAEHDGADEGEVMRVIPSDYFFWCGNRYGNRNYFRKEFEDCELYQWTEDSPYED